MARGRRHFGTGTRRAFDTQRLGEAIKGPGLDTRHWVSYGRVAVVGEDGEPDFTDPHAVHIEPAGVTVDVLLMPALVPATCRYSGLQGGPACTVLSPIHPGDEVLVVLPDGEAANVPVIVAILTSDHSPLPVDQDGKPFFRNDRLSIVANNIRVDIRTSGGARAQLQPDGSASVEVPPGKTVQVGSTGLSSDDGVVTGQGIDTFTGLTYAKLGNASTTVLAKR